MSRHVGRVKMHRNVASTTVPPDPTTAMPKPPEPVPVFVDDSGKRRRRLRYAVAWLGALALLVVAAIWWNQSAEPLRPAPIRTCATSSAHGGGCPSR